MAFLAAKHKMMKFIVKSVKKREFMKLMGVICIQVRNIFTFKREESPKYDIEEVISQARTTIDREEKEILQGIKKEQLGLDISHIDHNNNHAFTPEPDSTALMIACCNDNLQMVKLLLDNNADPNILPERECTALMHACRNPKMVKIILAQHADAIIRQTEPMKLYCIGHVILIISMCSKINT